MRTAGRMRPAAHPQTEFTIIIVVPAAAAARSTSAAVRSSCTPALVSSSRMGISMSSGYMETPRVQSLVVSRWLLVVGLWLKEILTCADDSVYFRVFLALMFAYGSA